MRKTLRRAVVGAVSTVLAMPAVGFVAATPAEAADYKVLVVGKTTGFRHSSIDEGTRAVIALGQSNGFTVDVFDPAQTAASIPGGTKLDTTPFTTAANLAQYKTLVFISTVDGTNNVNATTPANLLNDTELAALQGYIRAGGGYAGVHAATDTMHRVPWYGQLTGGGARFRNHPNPQNAVMRVEDPTHPSTDMLPAAWPRFDEWYNFTANPRGSVRVLITLDESTYNPGSGRMGADHPLSWCQNFEGGRSWYEAAGHTEASFADPTFLAHLLGGIEWTAGVTTGGGDCVTFYEVNKLIDDLVATDSLSASVAASLKDRLERAQVRADRGNETQAIAYLEQAVARAENQIKGDAADAEVQSRVVSKLEDLVEWQQGLDDNENSAL